MRLGDGSWSVFDAAREAPAEAALTDGDNTLSFAELAERVRERQRSMDAAFGAALAPGTLVAVATDAPGATIEVLLALIERGLPFLPLHPRATAVEREALLAGLPVPWLLEPTEAGLAIRQRAATPSPALAELFSHAPGLAALATTGSTGAPRVAVLSRAAFAASAAASAAYLGWQPGDRWLLCLPLAHIGGLSVVTRCLLARATIALSAGGSTASSSERLRAAIERARPTLISLVPAQLAGLLELEPPIDLPSSVRVMLTGGAAASPALLARCAERRWPVSTSYGLTEACSQVATHRPGAFDRGEPGVGLPLPGVGVHIENGLIVISGPTLASAYLAPGGLLERIGGEGGFRTRDLGCIDDQGRLHVLGRVGDLIISGGENVMPWEIESELASCPGVLEACAFGVPDPRWGELIVLGVRTHERDEAALVRALDERARERLASYKRPRRYVCVPEFRYNRTGKLDRAGTLQMLEALARAGRGRAPSE